MPSPLIIITGTGTGIGKTFLATALVRAWARRGKLVLGYKPIESGVDGGQMTDAELLRAASTFHVKHLLHLRFRAPVSPHLAARKEGGRVDLDLVVTAVDEVRAKAEAVIVELPGGLFTPLTEGDLAIDLAARLRPTAVVLVVPDQLGVLHDAIAACEAARGRPVSPTHILLNEPAIRDDSTATNAAELSRFLAQPVFGPVMRGEASSPTLDALLESIDPATTE